MNPLPRVKGILKNLTRHELFLYFCSSALVGRAKLRAKEAADEGL
jgi:hypothetical protein